MGGKVKRPLHLPQIGGSEMKRRIKKQKEYGKRREGRSSEVHGLFTGGKGHEGCGVT